MLIINVMLIKKTCSHENETRILNQQTNAYEYNKYVLITNNNIDAALVLQRIAKKFVSTKVLTNCKNYH